MRFRWLVGNYQQSDLVVSQVKAFFPFRFAPHTTGPLAASGFWPDEPAAVLEQARKPTLVFVHLIAPHFPYLYRKDGSIRDLREWTSDRVDQRSHREQYDDRYRRYCEQLEFVSTQLDTVFDRLRQAGLYDSTHIVLHGDHGSRIRGTLPEGVQRESSFRPAGSDPEVYDYAGTAFATAPPTRDLLDRFSALLADKPAHAVQPVTDTRAGSLLRFLTETLPLGNDPQAGPQLDSVYLFDSNNRPIEIPMTALQRNAD
jgi:arylsulfatase A-like enzyme